MRVHHRRAHRRLWLILPGLLAVLFIAALALRPPPLGEVTPWPAEASR